MNSQGSFLWILAASPLVILVLHAVLSRSLRALRPSAPAQGVAAAAVLLGFPIVGWCSWSLHGAGTHETGTLWAAAVYGALVYCCLGYSYFHLFNLSETARRMRILYELRGSGPMTDDELARRYPGEQGLDLRLERLVALGQLSVKDGRYRLSSRLLWAVAAGLAVWGRALGSGLAAK